MASDKKIYNILSDETVLHTRRNLLKNAAVACAGLSIPLTFLQSCSGSSSPGSSVKTGSSFEITFSKPMDTASVEQALSIAPGDPGFLVNSPVWSQSDTVMLYECESTVTGNYTLTIEVSAKDKAGNYIDGNSDGTGGDEYSGAMAF